MKQYQIRLSEAIAYWLERGENRESARLLAIDQIDFEDGQEDPNIQWKGPNDSLTLHSY